MSRIMAFIDYSPVSHGVIGTASALAELVGADLDVVHVRVDADPLAPGFDARLLDGSVEEVIVDELGAGDVLCGVIGSRSMLAKPQRVGHVADRVLARAMVPLVIVPPTASGIGDTARPTILVPHDDTGATARALGPMLELLAEAGASFIMLHVFDDRSVPLTDSSHDLDTIAEEFLLRYRGGKPERCELRIGHAGTQIVDVASGRDIDAVLVAWRQQTGPGRADVIMHLFRESDVPLIVVPFTD